MTIDGRIDLTADEVALPAGLATSLKQAFLCQPSPEVAEQHVARLQVLATRLRSAAPVA